MRGGLATSATVAALLLGCVAISPAWARDVAATRSTVHAGPGSRFPSAERLEDGTVLVAFHAESPRGGRLLLARRRPGRPSWSVTEIYEDDQPYTVMNLGLSRLKSGTLLLPFWKAADIYVNTSLRVTGSFLIVSRLGGRSWGARRTLPTPRSGGFAPYGKVIEVSRRALLMPGYTTTPTRDRAVLLRSRDRGRSWHAYSTIRDTFNETAVAALTPRHLVAASRGVSPAMGSREAIHVIHSDDAGRTWGRARPLYGGVSPELIRLRDGRLLLCYADRPAREIDCSTSVDGRTWSPKVTVARPSSGDLGYPSSVELNAGRVLTTFYDAGRIDAVTYRVGSRGR